MPDVGTCLIEVQRLKIVSSSNSLIKLPQLGSRQLIGQFWLTNENNLEQLLIIGFEIRQKTNLLQHIKIEVLRLVNHQDRFPTAVIVIE